MILSLKIAPYKANDVKMVMKLDKIQNDNWICCEFNSNPIKLLTNWLVVDGTVDDTVDGVFCDNKIIEHENITSEMMSMMIWTRINNDLTNNFNENFIFSSINLTNK